ncbi:hypothetical protein QBC46DRAFT_401356 [Diplogelasinospora grovesii]|uniref:RING-type domain-containing protein n=1 Tax=Diplogelasinospora grovesii TaxID=303347 RepID=A0AAN6MVJ6_9PEZI|nr:hypothetical protein QBC46DRAFT_401356 [Diplogelasinospora grovesii]
MKRKFAPSRRQSKRMFASADTIRCGFFPLRHYARAGPRREIPSKTVTIVDLTDETVENCTNCSGVVEKREEREGTVAYKVCGCVSCTDCIPNIKTKYSCLNHFGLGPQKVVRLYGTKCCICYGRASVVPRCGHSYCDECLDRYKVTKKRPDQLLCGVCREPLNEEDLVSITITHRGVAREKRVRIATKRGMRFGW